MSIKIALAGNPNSGKTTMFNDLTGSSQYVGNWPGVTVEKKEGRFRNTGVEATIQDLPGIYSLSPFSLEEVISRNYIVNDKPDAILNIVDSTNIERNLYLTTQLFELGIPVTIALNMIDLSAGKGITVDSKRLSQELGCGVFETSASKRKGSAEAAAAAAKTAGMAVTYARIFSDDIENALDTIAAYLPGTVQKSMTRWYSVKVFERDDKVMAQLNLSKAYVSEINKIIGDLESSYGDDSASIIANGRYQYIEGIVKKTVKKDKNIKKSASEKIDSVLTHRVLAIPIFIAVMFLVYFISITTIGGILTDWTNDTLFGEWIIPGAESLMEAWNVNEVVAGLLVDGVISGVGAVLGFVPQMLVLFILLAILEECGYMARIAFILDRIFRKFGLSGKSFIPMLIGTGCAVPGIMASRTVESEKERRMTILTTSFMPCGAKMPIVALMAGAIFGGAWWVAPSAYFIGIGAIIISGLILKKFRYFSGENLSYVMELPDYHAPTASGVLRSMWERGWSFIKRAGTVILLASVIIWILSSFGTTPDGFGMVEEMDDSILASAGNAIAWIFEPNGFGSWQATVATIMGLVAKEEVVGVFGVLFGIGEGALDLVEEGAFNELAPIAAAFTALGAYSFLVFNLLCAPCFAAIGAIKREMNSTKWTLFAVGYQTVFAYTISLIVYQLGLLFTGGGFGAGTAVAFVLLACYIWLLVRRQKKSTLSPSVAVSPGS